MINQNGRICRLNIYERSGEMTKKRVLLGLSGGTDSTYAADRLMRDGFSVEGAVLRMHDFTDISAAKRSAGELGIPLHIIDCSEAFRSAVIENFLDEYVSARTPNPCIVCNREVKFRFLYEYAREHGFDKIATGHYARVVRVPTDDGIRYAVARAHDGAKDQTYMLWRLSQEQLSMLLLPLSDIKKEDVRRELQRIGSSAADRSDSQEICFIPDGNYAAFVEEHRGIAPRGNFVDGKGKVLGSHGGIINYTVGQRKGLGISLGARAFVTDIDAVSNTVTLGTEPKMSREVHISDMIFSGMKRPDSIKEAELFVKLRYQALPVAAAVTFIPEGGARLRLSEPAKSVTPGQSAVLYDGDTVVAGGVIDVAL